MVYLKSPLLCTQHPFTFPFDFERFLRCVRMENRWNVQSKAMLLCCYHSRLSLCGWNGGESDEGEMGPGRWTIWQFFAFAFPVGGSERCEMFDSIIESPRLRWQHIFHFALSWRHTEPDVSRMFVDSTPRVAACTQLRFVPCENMWQYGLCHGSLDGLEEGVKLSQ